MNAAVRDCLVTGYELLADALELPDPDVASQNRFAGSYLHLSAGGKYWGDTNR